MKSLTKSLLITACLLPMYAMAGEPIVTAPDPAQILSLIKPCAEPGFSKIPAHSKILITGRNIPRDGYWFWQYAGNGDCQRLTALTALVYSAYEQTGNKSGAEIRLGYGLPKQPVAFIFRFTIPAGQCAEGECYYDCGPLIGTEPPSAFGCELMNDKN